MLSSTIIILLFVYAWFQRNIIIALLILPSFFFFILAYELKDSSLANEYLQHDIIKNYDIYILFGLFLFLSYVLALTSSLTGRDPSEISPTSLPLVSISKIKKCYYFISFISIISFIINFSNVEYNLLLLLQSPRDYELNFGASTIINYLYFLNTPALCLWIYIRLHGGSSYLFLIINIILVLISFFHGIKFTVFDTLLLPALFYYHCSRSPRQALLFVATVLIALLIFYLAFSMFVRGFSNEEGPVIIAVLNYILPNYYNLAYSFQLNPFQIDPFSFLMPDKFPNPFIDIISPGEFGFLLNDRFNMSTAYAVIYSSLPPLSWIIFIPLIVGLRNWIVRYARTVKTLHWFFVSAYVDFCIFFFWYFYAFNKTKYIYYLFVMLILGGYIHAKRRRSKI